MEPQTDREIMMKIDSKLDSSIEAIERIANTLERLENVKFEEHDSRIASLEKFKYQIMGALALVVALDVVISLIKYLATIPK